MALSPLEPRCEVEDHRRQRTFFDRRTRRVYGAIRDIPGPHALSRQGLSAFVYLGYVPGTATLFQDVDCLPGGTIVELDGPGWRVVRRRRYADAIRERPYGLGSLPDAAIHELGARLFLDAVTRSLVRTGPIVVPLSGGLDSRAILGALLELVSPREIATYTYGVPGALDFDIGNAVAQAAGTRHTIIDLRHVPFDAERLIETARATDANANLFHPFVWTEVRRRFGTGVTIWSGFTGDGLGGSFYQPHRGSVQQAVRDFVDREAAPSHWPTTGLAVRDVDPLVAQTTKYDGVLSPHEAVWFENHVERYTAHQIFMAGLTYATPFMDAAFVQFMLEAGPIHRAHKRTFDAMVSRRFPALFRWPTRDYGFKLAGRPCANAAWMAWQVARRAGYRLSGRRTTHPRLTYSDFDWGLRHRKDLKAVVRQWLEDLARRDVLDAGEIRRLWSEHQRGAHQASALLLLASVEGCLKAFADNRA